ncbi:MAG: DUF2141 domain-containing protein [Bacteroidales bacterium]|nr:DUF2141 domain-containing protein [Bacteroidales bacterium]
MVSLFKKQRVLYVGIILIVLISAFKEQSENPLFSLAVKVENLSNEKGVVVIALYTREDSFPDEHYEKYYQISTNVISNRSASYTFNNLPTGKYAINVLHDENNDGEIDKGLVLPKEGIGFSNYHSIGIFNKPTFNKASFNIRSDTNIKVKVIYF